MYVSIKILIGFIFIFKNLLEMIVYVNYIFSLTKLMYDGTLSLLLMKSYLNQIKWFAFHALTKATYIECIDFYVINILFIKYIYIILFLIKFKEYKKNSNKI